MIKVQCTLCKEFYEEGNTVCTECGYDPECPCCITREFIAVPHYDSLTW